MPSLDGPAFAANSATDRAIVRLHGVAHIQSRTRRPSPDSVMPGRSLPDQSLLTPKKLKAAPAHRPAHSRSRRPFWSRRARRCDSSPHDGLTALWKSGVIVIGWGASFPFWREHSRPFNLSVLSGSFKRVNDLLPLAGVRFLTETAKRLLALPSFV